MSKKNEKTGGPAFPVPSYVTYTAELGNHIVPPVPGMTLRDYFAGQALAGLCANPALIDSVGKTGSDWLKRNSFLIADTMLEARNE